MSPLMIASFLFALALFSVVNAGLAPVAAPLAAYAASPYTTTAALHAAGYYALPPPAAYAASYVTAPAAVARAFAPAPYAVAPSPYVSAVAPAPLAVAPAPVVAKTYAAAPAPLVAAAPAPAPAPLAAAVSNDIVDPYPQYKFAYDVQDTFTGDSKTQEETRDGDVVRGSYSLIEPDGSRRIVNYYADPVNGFNAVVQKDVPVIAGKAVAAPLVAAAPAPVVAKSFAAPIIA